MKLREDMLPYLPSTYIENIGAFAPWERDKCGPFSTWLHFTSHIAVFPPSFALPLPVFLAHHHPPLLLAD